MSKYTGATTLESMSQARFYNKWIFNKFKNFLKGEILEVGCGIGNFTKTLSNYGAVTAIDIDKNLLENIVKEKDPRMRVGYGDIEKGEYFFNDKRFDALICINVLEHIKDDARALDNMLKLLRNKGNMILLVPIYDFLYGEIDKTIGHFRRYNPEELIARIKDLGFIITYHKKLNFPGALGWFIAGKIFKNKHVEADKIQLFNILSPLFLFIENFMEPIIGTSILIIAKKT